MFTALRFFLPCPRTANKFITTMSEASTLKQQLKQPDSTPASSEPGTNNKKGKNKGKKGGRKKEEITPEYIAEQRRLRELKKAQKKQDLLDKGIDPDNVVGSNHIKRQLLTIPHNATSTTDDKTLDFTIMTYNLLAQALIRRTLFPTNGDILKWSKRSRVLLHELKFYNSDIMCLQEMDFVQFNSYWKVELGKLGYLNKFYRSGEKNHGVAIFYKEALFNLVDICHIDYDKEETGNIAPRTITTNIGLVLALSLKSHPSKIILVGTTHLFWHPFGTYERTRQTYIVLSKMNEFQKRIQILHPEFTKIWKFFAGDFNSQPFDSPYLSITSKPIEYDGRCKTVISCSTSFQYSSLRLGGSGEEEEGGNIEKFGEGQPKDPVPETFNATDDQLAIVRQMQDLHNSLPLRAISLYSVAYKLIDPKNAGLDNDRNEPFFSNWAHTWRGLLDYIFVIRDWDLYSDNSKIDELDTFENDNDIILKKLLKLPHPDEMDEGQPREGQYPSDHLCMIAEVGLKL